MSGAVGNPNDRPDYGPAGPYWHDGRVTAPLTPRDEPPGNSHDPWQAPQSPQYPKYPQAPYDEGRAAAHGRPGPGLGTELIEAAVVVVGVGVLGVLVGFLWERLAPRVVLTVASTGVFLRDSESEDAVGIDGTFALLGLACGVFTAVVVFLARRRGGVVLVLALAAGGFLGSLLAWKLGVWLGPTEDVVGHARQVGEGGEFDAPLELQAKGALLAWPLGAMTVQLVLTGLFGPRDPQPPLPPQAGGWQGWGSPTA